jgi:hypothetical protein
MRLQTDWVYVLDLQLVGTDPALQQIQHPILRYLCEQQEFVVPAQLSAPYVRRAH